MQKKPIDFIDAVAKKKERKGVSLFLTTKNYEKFKKVCDSKEVSASDIIDEFIKWFIESKS